MMTGREVITVASAGTTSSAFNLPGFRLVGLILPTLDSTTVGFAVSEDGTNWTTVYTNTGTPAAATLGTADTGGKAVAVPEEIGRLAACAHMRLIVAAQNGGARSITGLFEAQ